MSPRLKSAPEQYALGESIEITKEMLHNGFALDLIVRDPVDPVWRIEHDDFFL